MANRNRKKTKQTDKLQLKLESCPHFVSDPPGENELKGRYEVAGGGSMQIERYQLGSDTCLSVMYIFLPLYCEL